MNENSIENKENEEKKDMDSRANPQTVIHLTEGWEINRWCEELNLREDELVEIVKKVGPSLEDVKEYLNQRRSPSGGPLHH